MTVKKTIQIIGMAGILSLASLTMTGCVETKKQEEMKEMATYISPKLGEERTYQLPNGSHAVITKTDESKIFLSYNRLEINVDDIVKFYSGEYRGTDLDGKIELDILALRDGNRWEYFPKNKIDNYQLWQERYEKILSEMYSIRSSFEREKGNNLDSLINQ